MTASKSLDEVERVAGQRISAARDGDSRRADLVSDRRRAPSKRRAMVAVAVVIAALGFALRVYAPGPITETTDEPVFLPRTDTFRQALVSGDLAGVTAVYRRRGFVNDTMPAITTMWAGTLGRAAAVASGEVGLSHKVVGSSNTNATVLRADRAVVALWCSVALGLIVYLAWRLFGRGTALIAGVLLATEPLLVGLSGIFHTDAMVAMFSAVSLLALAVGLGLATRGNTARALPRRHQRRWLQIAQHGEVGWLAASGVFAGLAMLTKLNAIAMLVPGAIVVGAVAWQAHRPSLRVMAQEMCLWLAAALVVFVALWPALWVAPAAQFSAMLHSLGQLGASPRQFLLGDVTSHPGPVFYVVVFWFRATPWLLAGAVAAIGLAVARLVHRLHPRHPLESVVRHFDRVPLWPLAVCVPYLATITWSAKKFDRYLLAVFPFLAVVVGAIVSAAVLAIAPWHRWHNWIAVAGLVGTIGLVANVAVQAPYAISYADPLVGGQRAASHAILLGWNQGVERLGATIARERAGRCAETVVVTDTVDLPLALPCGVIANANSIDRADYVITSIDQSHRGLDAPLLPMLQRAMLVRRITIGGVTYAELWRVRKVGANLTPAAH